MDRTIASILQRLNADPEEMRELERKRMSAVFVERYLGSPQHEQFLKLARKLGTVPYLVPFTEEDNSCLTVTYDLYLNRNEWIQICFQLVENGSATVTVYDKDSHYVWDDGDTDGLEERIVQAMRNPRTFESVVA